MSDYQDSPYNDDYSSSFDGAQIADQSVSIGNILFEGWEVPERVCWGGGQRMTVHKLVGGSRFIDTMGPDNSDVAWSGRFLSPDAAFRADQLDLLRKSGSQVDVIFAGRYYSAVISQFSAEQLTQFHICYHICITILADESAIGPPVDPPPIVLVASDLGFVVGFGLVAPELLIAQASAALVVPLLAPLAILEVGAAATAAIAGAVGGVIGAIDAVELGVEVTIAGLATTALLVGNLAGAVTVIDAVAAMQAALAATYAVASAVTMGAYMSRAGINVGLQAGVGIQPGTGLSFGAGIGLGAGNYAGAGIIGGVGIGGFGVSAGLGIGGDPSGGTVGASLGIGFAV